MSEKSSLRMRDKAFISKLRSLLVTNVLVVLLEFCTLKPNLLKSLGCFVNCKVKELYEVKVSCTVLNEKLKGVTS